MCDITQFYACHESFTCVTWLIDICAIGSTHTTYCVLRDMTHSYVWHDSFIYVTILIHVCTMTLSYACHDWFICYSSDFHVSFTCHSFYLHVIPLIHNNVYVISLIYMSFRCFTRHSSDLNDISLIHTDLMTFLAYPCHFFDWYELSCHFSDEHVISPDSYVWYICLSSDLNSFHLCYTDLHVIFLILYSDFSDFAFLWLIWYVWVICHFSDWLVICHFSDWLVIWHFSDFYPLPLTCMPCLCFILIYMSFSWFRLVMSLISYVIPVVGTSELCVIPLIYMSFLWLIFVFAVLHVFPLICANVSPLI